MNNGLMGFERQGVFEVYLWNTCALPLLSPHPLSSGSPSAHPQSSICVCQYPSVLRLEDPLSPPPASESRTPPQPIDPLPPLPRGPVVHWLHWAPSSLRLHLGLSSSILRLRDSTPLASPRPSVTSASPRPPGSTAPHQLPEPSVPPRPSGSSSSPWVIDCPSPPQTPPPPALPPVGPLEISALPPPWHLPLSASPWVIIIAVAWVPPGSSCSKSLLSPSGLPWSLLSSPWYLPPSSPPWTLFFILLLYVRPPPEPPPKFPSMPPSVVVYGVRTCLPGGFSSLVCQYPSALRLKDSWSPPPAS
ncbi:hypothetical protein H4Q32_007170 [Labeo rohita]|uniref:Vegetative cell wall protein gp1-like n=1 Tax=Labeo rohita TaxID=84645 RepID=A0ABQ8MI77_LABRO|nr:hypothetical protein H4Q32_007170 [Labeo rohita]